MRQGVPFLNKGRDQVLPAAAVPQPGAPATGATTSAAQP
jgi:hypothetical protein